MTPPISPSDLQRVLKTLPPEAPDPFPHLADLTPDALLRRKVRITQIAQRCEQERHVIDAELLSAFGDAELRFGVRAPGGRVLKQRSLTSWNTTQKFGTPSRVFRVRHNGMGGHNRL